MIYLIEYKQNGKKHYLYSYDVTDAAIFSVDMSEQTSSTVKIRGIKSVGEFLETRKNKS